VIVTLKRGPRFQLAWRSGHKTKRGCVWLSRCRKTQVLSFGTPRGTHAMHTARPIFHRNFLFHPPPPQPADHRRFQDRSHGHHARLIPLSVRGRIITIMHCCVYAAHNNRTTQSRRLAASARQSRARTATISLLPAAAKRGESSGSQRRENCGNCHPGWCAKQCGVCRRFGGARRLNYRSRKHL
jgi:hypothetical protein